MALPIAAAIVVCGCGAGSTYSPTPTPVAQDAIVTGQYNLVLTSTSGHGTTNIYTDFTQTGKTFTGTASTLVCPSNDVSQCIGNDPLVSSITPSGTISGSKVTIMVTFPTTGGTDTVSMAGTATGMSLSGNYTDGLGDAGTWTASQAIYPFLLQPSVYDYTGALNSTSNPLTISPTVSLELQGNTASLLTGTATILNWPCVSSLSLSGEAMGDAFRLTDTTNKLMMLAIPAQPTATGLTYTFRYEFDASASSCAGDTGHGNLTSTSSPWAY